MPGVKMLVDVGIDRADGNIAGWVKFALRGRYVDDATVALAAADGPVGIHFKFEFRPSN